MAISSKSEMNKPVSFQKEKRKRYEQKTKKKEYKEYATQNIYFYILLKLFNDNDCN